MDILGYAARTIVRYLLTLLHPNMIVLLVRSEAVGDVDCDGIIRPRMEREDRGGARLVSQQVSLCLSSFDF